MVRGQEGVDCVPVSVVMIGDHKDIVCRLLSLVKIRDLYGARVRVYDSHGGFAGANEQIKWYLVRHWIGLKVAIR